MLFKALSVLFIAATTFACEKDCRAGVSINLADAYKPVIQKTMNDLESSLFTSIQQPDIPEEVKNNSSICAAIEDSIRNTLFDFEVYATNYTQLAAGIHHVLFDEEQPYKGDCNNPARLSRKIPPLNESWTMEECEKMDYRCGNPPSICHFFDDVKQRVVGFIRRQLTECAKYSSGKLIGDLVRNIRDVLNVEKFTLQETNIDKVVAAMVRSVDTWVNKNVHEICETPEQQHLCNDFDNDVKLAILKWP